MKTKLRFIKSKTEAFFWLLFFFVAGGFGFVQGWKPEVNLTQLLGGPEQIEVLTSSLLFFPSDIMAEIEKETGTEIKITPLQNWEDVRVKSLSDSNVSFLFLPSHWVQALRQENLLHDSRRLKSTSGEVLSPDFNFNPDSTGQDFLPIYWTRLSIVSKIPAPKTLGLMDDSDVAVDIFEKLREKKGDTDFLKLKFQFFKIEDWNLNELNMDAALVPHIWAERHPEWKPQLSWPEFLALWGFAMPKNSKLSSKMERFLRAYASAETQARILESLPLASTLIGMDQRPGPLAQKALYLRDLGMRRLNLVRQHNPAHLKQARDLTSLSFSK